MLQEWLCRWCQWRKSQASLIPHQQSRAHRGATYYNVSMTYLILDFWKKIWLVRHAPRLNKHARCLKTCGLTLDWHQMCRYTFTPSSYSPKISYIPAMLSSYNGKRTLTKHVLCESNQKCHNGQWIGQPGFGLSESVMILDKRHPLVTYF